MKRIFIILFLTGLCSSTLFANLSADQIMAKVIEKQNADTSALDIKLTLIDSNGKERERRLQTLSKTVDGKTSSLTVFLSPESVKNTRFLSIENDEGNNEQWIYLPSLKRSRRIAGSEEAGSFMGSDFSYADMASMTYDSDQATNTLLSEDGTSYTIQSIPNDTKNYGKTITTITKDTFLPLQVEFYDSDGISLLKTLKTDNITEMGGRSITQTVVMTTIADNHSTRLEMLQVRYDMSLPDGYFTVKFLETGRL